MSKKMKKLIVCTLITGTLLGTGVCHAVEICLDCGYSIYDCRCN